MSKKEYALYKGDSILTVGTREELAEYLEVSPTTISFYHSPWWRKYSKETGYLVIDIEDDTFDNNEDYCS